jgi:hypothetical protein
MDEDALSTEEIMMTPEDREQRKAERDAEQKAKLDEYVAEMVAGAPPFTDRQKDAIRSAFASHADRLAERFQVQNDNLSALRRAIHAR